MLLYHSFTTTTASQLIIALTVLVATSTWLGISDWRSRTVGYRAILACYMTAIAVNVLLPLVMAEHHHPAGTAGAIIIVGELIVNAIPTAVMIALLSGIIVMFWKLGLLASGDAYAIPGLLSMLLFVATPAMVAAYFIAAIAITAAIFIVKNVRNNIRYRKRKKDRLYGPLWHKLYLMLFCYYGNSADIRYAFVYGKQQRQDDGNNCTGVKIRRDYDEEPFYAGEEKAWLVPGLPVLSGFAPATIIIVVVAVVIATMGGI